MIRLVLASTLALVLAAPAIADVSTSSFAQPANARQLSDTERNAYREILLSLASKDYPGAASALDALPTGALTPLLRSELMLANPAMRDPDAITALLSSSPELPAAAALARYATQAPMLSQNRLVRVAGPSKRPPSRPAPNCMALASRVQPLLKAGDPASAEPLVEAAIDAISPEAMTEWREKVAWAYFQAGDDSSARRVAALAQSGAGEWAVDAAWVNGLSSWRAQDFAVAQAAFDRVASNAGDDETRTAALFWAARSATAAGKATDATTRLQSASRHGETFYGMLASAALGVPQDPVGALETADTDLLLRRPNVRAAAALVELGETARADQLLRYQARIGLPSEHAALIALSAKLGLPGTQIWLAQNAPAGMRTTVAARFPMPGWSPTRGWRVDPALIYAHALQESEFRTDAVSSAGARGLMQIMPTTAQLIARHKGDAVQPLSDPSVSFEYGQSYLEELAANGGTAGLLPKVIAAYNAGPGNVARWTAGGNDPLLFIESIPFLQTRAYVAIVMRNYWIYQRESGVAMPSLTAMAQGRWPMFPTRLLQTASAGAATHAPN